MDKYKKIAKDLFAVRNNICCQDEAAIEAWFQLVYDLNQLFVKSKDPDYMFMDFILGCGVDNDECKKELCGRASLE